MMIENISFFVSGFAFGAFFIATVFRYQRKAEVAKLKLIQDGCNTSAANINVQNEKAIAEKKRMDIYLYR